MKSQVELPENKTIDIEYSKKVYSPEYSRVDTIVVADRLIKEGKGQIKSVWDVGCGSGVIGLGIKKLNPEVKVGMSDKYEESVKFAERNAKKLKLDVEVVKADMLKGVERVDMIVANMPTFDVSQLTTTPLHGPSTAYLANNEDPMFMMKRLFREAKKKCLVLVVECQKLHQEKLQALAKDQGYSLVLKTDNSFAYLSVPA